MTACTDPREPTTVEGEDECFTCHGSTDNGNAAPPPAFWRDPAVQDVHQLHLRGFSRHVPVACESCHAVPEQVRDPGHIDSDLPAELVFDGLAVADGAEPSYDPGTQTCAGVYCHGATLIAGGVDTEPVWAETAGPADCDSCHGLPPEAPHPAVIDCVLCHGAVVDADNEIISPELHINAMTEVGDQFCDSCHGGDNLFAPPPDTLGNLDTTARGVGAHGPHLDGANWHADIACNECHLVPSVVDDEGHVDTALPAEVIFGGLAAANEAMPSFADDSLSCAGTYCHGATLAPGGSNTTPIWTVVDGTEAACGTCHGLPPGGDHPPFDACETCHGDVVEGDDLDDFVAPQLHIDGMVQLAELQCNDCHGASGDPDDPSLWAPPVDLEGRSETGEPSVGAHQSHLGPADWHAEIDCEDCHEVPEALYAPGHIDSERPAELTFSNLAGEVVYDFDDNTCAGAYCHGATLVPGGSLTEPNWTTVDGTQAACGTCHGLPPLGGHPDSDECAECHSSVVDALGDFVNPRLHINGRANF